MNVSELERLAVWYVDHYSQLSSLYNNLLSPIRHNASEAGKQPVESQLVALLDYLQGMTFENLSLQQLRLLSNLGVDQFIGRDGALYVEGSVRTAEYDPATAVNRINDALSKLSEAHSGFTQYEGALEALGCVNADAQEEHESIIIRVGFQNDASIENVTDWKESAKDWYEIIRGLAMAAGEAPEDTKIIGASTGSIILILAGTLSVTTLLALISKNIASVASDVIGIKNQVEDLRHKKWLSAAMEREFKKKEDSLKGAALKNILGLIKKRLPNLDGEKVTALEGSIKKLLSFNEKGGNVDFVAPETKDNTDEEIQDGNEERLNALTGVLAVIRDYQATREKLKLLTDQSEKT